MALEPLSDYSRLHERFFRRARKAGKSTFLKGKGHPSHVYSRRIRHLDADAEQLWIDEAQARHDAFLRGGLEVLAGDEVMDRARKRLQ